MKITATTTVTLERADGTVSSTVETVTAHAGDNPRMERAEAGIAATQSMNRALDRIAGADDA